MTDLTELASRVEAATGPDRELDFAILCVVDPRALKSGPLHGDPRYTASLDSAMTLVPEGCDWQYSSATGTAGVWQGSIKRPYTANAAAPSLALTAAALRARAAMGEG